MFANFTEAMLELFVTSLWETIVMVGISGVVGALLGIPLGVFLRLTDHGGVLENGPVNKLVGWVVNAVRSTPFIILLVAIIPLTRFVTGSSIGTAAAVAGFIDQGTLRAIAVTSPEPSPAFKGVPTIAATVPGYSVESWYGFFVPAGTPAPVIAKLNAAIKKASQAPEFLQKVAQEGLTVTASDPAEFDRYVKAEEARWRKVVKENNIKSD